MHLNNEWHIWNRSFYCYGLFGFKICSAHTVEKTYFFLLLLSQISLEMASNFYEVNDDDILIFSKFCFLYHHKLQYNSFHILHKINYLMCFHSNIYPISSHYKEMYFKKYVHWINIFFMELQMKPIGCNWMGKYSLFVKIIHYPIQSDSLECIYIYIYLWQRETPSMLLLYWNTY